jgi:serine/threonine protein phosphatase PrpC
MDSMDSIEDFITGARANIQEDVPQMTDENAVDRWEVKKQKLALLKKVIYDSFATLNKVILHSPTSFNSSENGSTLTVILITDDDFLVTANVGDT